MSSGLFISLEGIDGSGKSTQLNLLKEELIKRGYEVVVTSEPTTTKLGKILRDYLSNPDSVPYADALVFAADRVEHYHEFIKPLLDSGKIVITDRYTASSIVYQGSQGVPKDWIQEINKMSPNPDLSFYIEISVEVALERLGDSQRTKLEKFENRDYLIKIVKNYQQIDYLIPIPGEGDPVTVTLAIVEKIIKKLSK